MSDHGVEPTEAVRGLAVALCGDDGGGHGATRALLQPGVRERGPALGQQLRGRDAAHGRRRRHLARGPPGRQVLPRRGEERELGEQQPHVELGEHVEPSRLPPSAACEHANG